MMGIKNCLADMLNVRMVMQIQGQGNHGLIDVENRKPLSGCFSELKAEVDSCSRQRKS